MGTWSALDTILAIVAVLGVSAAVFFFVKSRQLRDDRGPVSLSESPSVGRTEANLRAAELADRLRLIHEHQAIVTQALTQLVSRSDATAFQPLKDREALQRHSRMLVELATSALNDMRRTMDITGLGAGAVDEWPTLDSMLQLFADAEEHGLIVNLEESGERFPLSTSAELAVIRILTEAIDNARIHGGDGTEVDVSLTWGPHGLSIVVNDDGERAAVRRATDAGVNAPAPVSIESDQAALIEKNVGRGLLEMRNRAEAFDGVLHTQRVPGVGFTVTASFPMLRYATNPVTPSASDA
jgi:signal transduction histidine kinase